MKLTAVLAKRRKLFKKSSGPIEYTDDETMESFEQDPIGTSSSHWNNTQQRNPEAGNPSIFPIIPHDSSTGIRGSSAQELSEVTVL